MSFTWPEALIGLLIVPAIVLLYVWAQRRRHRYTLRYSSVAIASQAVSSNQRIRRHIPAALFTLAVAAMVLAIARPTASFPTPASAGLVILVLDTSGSMRGTDIAPSRIEAAEIALRDFVNRQPKGTQIGLVTFAASAQLVAAPTTDRKEVLKRLTFMQLQRGTNIGDGLQVAFNAIVEAQGGELSPGTLPQSGAVSPAAQSVADPGAAVIVLLSDGASTQGPPPAQVAAAIGRAGIKTYTVGVGTAQSGGSAAQRMDEAELRTIAQTTGGKYFSAKNADQLEQIYENLAKRTSLQTKQTELTFLAAGIGMLLMVGASVLGAMWSNRLP